MVRKKFFFLLFVTRITKRVVVQGLIYVGIRPQRWPNHLYCIGQPLVGSVFTMCSWSAESSEPSVVKTLLYLRRLSQRGAGTVPERSPEPKHSRAIVCVWELGIWHLGLSIFEAVVVMQRERRARRNGSPPFPSSSPLPNTCVSSVEGRIVLLKAESLLFRVWRNETAGSFRRR